MKSKISRADIMINGYQKGGLTTFQAVGSKVSAADDAADAHIEQHNDHRLVFAD